MGTAEVDVIIVGAGMAGERAKLQEEEESGSGGAAPPRARRSLARRPAAPAPLPAPPSINRSPRLLHTGVTAARALADAGAGHRVIVLEGRERSGGRLLATPTVAGGAVDLGAMWVHEASTGNALYNRIVELGLPLRCAC